MMGREHCVIYRGVLFKSRPDMLITGDAYYLYQVSKGWHEKKWIGTGVNFPWGLTGWLCQIREERERLSACVRSGFRSRLEALAWMRF